MKTRGRYPGGRTGGRNQVEDYQAMMLAISMDLDEIRLRINQAMKRSSAVADVLGPAVERLDGISEQVAMMQDGMFVIWHERNAVQWQVAEAEEKNKQ